MTPVREWRVMQPATPAGLASTKQPIDTNYPCTLGASGRMASHAAPGLYLHQSHF